MKPGTNPIGQPIRQNILRPIAVARAGRVAAVDADRDLRQSGRGLNLTGQRGELLGEGRVGGRVVLRRRC